MNLPYEIYLQIFNLLNKDTLISCTIVCKYWSLPAFQVYYKELTINENSLNILKRLLDKEQCFKYCHWTEELYIHQEEVSYYLDESGEIEAIVTFTKQEFLKFFEYLPNLKKIELCTYSCQTEYMRYLRDIDTSQYLTRLGNIIFEIDSFNDVLYDLYYSVYYNFRASLTRISLYNMDKSVLAFHYGGILSFLSQFKKLTRLAYYNNSKDYITIYEIQVACPSLNSIEIHDYYTTPSFQADSNTFYQDSNLKELSIYFANIPIDYIEYIIKYLPKSVESLNITIKNIDLYDWVYQVGIDNILKLAGLMSKLPHASLLCTPHNRYETQHENFDESNMTTFYKILNAFKGDKKTRCAANFSDLFPSHHAMTFSDGDLRINYGLHHGDLYENRGEDLVFQLAVPDRTVSVIGPEVINVPVFVICIVDIELAFKSLKYLLVNFQHLQHVEFESIRPHHEFTLSSSLDYGEKDYNLSTTSRENLKVVRLKYFIPSQEFIDLLNFYLPDIQNFGCGGRRDRQFNDKGVPRDYIVDLTHLQSLQIFYFDIQLVLNDSKLNSCFIKLEYMDGEENYYQFTDEAYKKFKPISFEKLQTYPISTIIFKCQRIKKFVLYNSDEGDVLDILQGFPQIKRTLSSDDVKYIGTL
ncbi:hypothetical protein HPULCUR_010588 [Helicostylum pulchrum]|uniref:F-box domain-containing protein n=1 Tax=Helicostylum pulchrum TaxID=562976 RepID=A0ABP9YE36_9FUNG